LTARFDKSGGVEGDHVWMTCCGAVLARVVAFG
jgi:hypothetical protein